MVREKRTKYSISVMSGTKDTSGGVSQSSEGIAHGGVSDGPSDFALVGRTSRQKVGVDVAFSTDIMR